MTSRPGLAAITLDPKGGGVAAVSRLLWQAMTDEWGPDCALVTLVADGSASLDTAAPERLRFGARVAWQQFSGKCRWLLYSHLAVAKAQEFVPPPVRRPYAVFLHGIEAWRPVTPAQECALRGASALITNSAHTACEVARVHPWIGPIAICPLALPQDARRDPAGESGDGRWGPRAVLLVGRMASAERYKGHDQLLEAWPAVVAAVPDAQLVFVGDGDDRPRLAAKARTLGVAASVVTTGFVGPDALDAAYRSAAIFAMPSRHEGFGLVYLEAMAHGLPCIGSVHDAAAEIIEEGRTGHLVDQADREGLARQIASLLTHEAARSAMGIAGRQRLEARFTYGQFRARLVRVLADAFAEPLAPLPIEPEKAQ